MSIESGVGKGLDVGWEIRPCKYCEDGEARFPAGLFGGTSFNEVPAICDDCERRVSREILAKMVAVDSVDLVKRSGAPNPPPVDLHWRMANLINDDKRGLMIHGPPGTFKTSNAVELIRRWSQKTGKGSVYICEAEYFEAAWNKDTAFMNRIRQTPLLVIDDLGTKKQSEYGAGIFFDLVDWRYRSGEKTVFILNVPLSQIPDMQHFDDRIMRRIGEMCGQPMEMT